MRTNKQEHKRYHIYIGKDRHKQTHTLPLSLFLSQKQHIHTFKFSFFRSKHSVTVISSSDR